MAGNGSPDSPIVAVRLPDAEPVAAAAMPPAAAASPEPAAAAPAAAAAAPISEAAPIELVSERPSLLESFGKEAKPTDKPVAEIVKPQAAADKPKDGDVKPAEAKAAEAAEAPKSEAAKDAKPEGEAKPVEAQPEPLAPVEYVYELPNTLKMDDGLKTELHTALDTFRADPAKGVQPLIDLHNKIVGDVVTQNAAETLRNQHKAFNDTRSQWNTDWAADPEIGGSGYQTSMRAIARMRDQFVSDALPGTPKYQADLKGFEDFLRVTGAGDHPAFGRFLHNLARAFDEPAPPPVNTKPPPNHGQKPGSSKEKLYGPSQKAS